jgi:hypothetical protein
MSILSAAAICWLALNGAVFAALATRRSRPRLKARLFNWVLRSEPNKPRRPRERHPHPLPNTFVR